MLGGRLPERLARPFRSVRGFKRESAQMLPSIMRAKRNPDGSFDYEGTQYRLEQRSDDSFDVVRENDREVVGRLHVAPATSGGPVVSVLPGAALPEVAGAISLLMAEPLGVLPLQ